MMKMVPAILGCLLVCAGHVFGGAPEVESGRFDLRIESGLISLRAQDAPLGEIVSRLEEALGVHLRISGGTDDRVTGNFESATVKGLLSDLGVNHVLFYRRDRDSGVLRLSGGSVSGLGVGASSGDSELDRAIAAHIENLRDDDVPDNANTSLRALVELGDVAIPALEAALSDGDYQMRQYAADALERLGDRYAPSARFLEVLVEGLAHDALPSTFSYDPKSPEHIRMRLLSYVANARRGLHYFRDGPPDLTARAMQVLARALTSPDGQQRFLSALILANHEYGQRLTELIAPILVAHLADNRLGCDASSAAPALTALGASARPYVERATASADPQQADYARKIVEEIDLGRPVYFMSRTPSIAFHDWIPEAFPDRNGNYSIAPRPRRGTTPSPADLSPESQPRPRDADGSDL